MKTWSGPIYNKTALAHEELATRSHGLGPRLRQLLILIDGQRTEEQLVRLIPRTEFDEYLPVLEQGGFIVRRETPGEVPTSVVAPVPVTDLADAAPVAAFPDAAPSPSATVDGQATVVSLATSPLGGDDRDETHEQMRERIVSALHEVIGTHGDELAERVARCASRRELRELMPAALSIVEIVGGRKALTRFQELAGLRSS